MKDDFKCLRCNNPMSYIKREKLQLGQTGWVLRDLPNLIAGALEVDIYSCRECGKLEFHRADDFVREEGIAQTKCPRCGRMHDMDYPKCPFCRYDSRR